MRIPIKIVVGDNLEVLDMFADESISIKSVVKDIKDPKKLFTDFSRSFTLPASKKNNKVFKHYYNIDIVNGLDSRELIPAKILMNNATYRVGNIRVDSVRISSGVAQQYKVTFIGKLSELSRQFGVDKLSSLDFSALDNTSFDFTTEIADLTKRDVMFPISSRADRFVYDSGTANLDLDNTRNIAYVTATPSDNYAIRANDLVGTLSCGAILDAIEAKYGFNFTGVFEDEYIRDLYLWLHQTDKSREGELLEGVASSLSGSPISNHWNLSTDTLVFLGTGGIPNTPEHERYLMRIKGTWTGDGKAQILRNGVLVKTIDTSATWSTYLPVDDYGVGDVYTFKALNESSLTISLQVELLLQEYEREEQNQGGQTGYEDVQDYTINGSAPVGTAGTYYIGPNLPKMNVIDFLSSLFKMFNIVAEVDNDLNVSTKHYDFFMSEGTIKDFTKYVSVDNQDVSRPNLYSSILMDFEEPKTALEQGFLAVNGRKYGELSYQLVGAEGVKLSGSEYKLRVDNQRVPIEPLNDLDDNSSTGICYTQFSDLKGAEQSIKPMFTYLTKKSSGDRIALYGSIITSSTTDYMMPCNTHNNNQAPPTFFNLKSIGLHFGDELNEYDTDSTFTGVGLWNSFYRGTTALMFSEGKRGVKFNAMIPQSQIINLKLSDILSISNHVYNINSIETNFLTGMSKLDLTLVGRNRLLQFNGNQKRIYNNNTSTALYITYIHSTTGLVTKGFVSANSNQTFNMVGSVCGFSHPEWTQEDV